MECRVHKLVADVAVLFGGRVLMVRYRDTARYDGQKGWFLPDDYLGFGEHPDEAAQRILQEQAGITLPSVRLAHIESFGNGAWHLVFHYAAELAEQPSITEGENVAAAEWFDLNDLPAPSDVAHEGWALDVLHQVLASHPDLRRAGR
jgi:ADP-ribose pyrophosphatase YjhB (NUDIX family)